MAQPRITLYEHINKCGRTLTADGDVPNFVDRCFNDKCSSIVVHSGVWELFEHVNYCGKKWIVWEGQDYSDWKKWGGQNDIISSARPVNVKTASYSGCIVYEHACYQGRCFQLSGPVHNFKDYCFNDTISSIRIIAGTWVAYADVNFQGPQLLLQGDTNICDIPGWNDRISSIRPIEFGPRPIVCYQ